MIIFTSCSVFYILFIAQKNYDEQLLDLISDNDQMTSDHLSAVKNILIKTFLKEEILIDYCKKIPEGLQGHLNSTQILKEANLSNLIQFYDAENRIKAIEQNKHKLIEFKVQKDRDNFLRDLFYLKVDEYQKKDLNSEDWLLWNTNNMTGLLNMSKDFLGSDGQRIELGNFILKNDKYFNLFSINEIKRWTLEA